MFYILLSHIENDQVDAILEGSFTDVEIEDYSFQSGFSVKMDEIDLPILFTIYEYTLRGRMTDHLSVDDIPGPVYSHKTKALFESLAIRNIEYYQLNLIDEFAESDYDEPRKNDKEKRVVE